MTLSESWIIMASKSEWEIMEFVRKANENIVNYPMWQWFEVTHKIATRDNLSTRYLSPEQYKANEGNVLERLTFEISNKKITIEAAWLELQKKFAPTVMAPHLREQSKNK